MPFDPLPDLPASSRPMQEAMADRLNAMTGAVFIPDYAAAVDRGWTHGAPTGTQSSQDYVVGAAPVLVLVAFQMVANSGRCELTIGADPDNNFWIVDDCSISGDASHPLNYQGVLRGLLKAGETYEVAADGRGGTITIYDVREVPSV